MVCPRDGISDDGQHVAYAASRPGVATQLWILEAAVIVKFAGNPELAGRYRTQRASAL